jgi:PAS domain S-box-containing protein
MTKTENIITKDAFDWDEYLSYIEDFVESNKKIDSFFELQKSGLTVFNKIPFSETVELFLINDDFEFTLQTFSDTEKTQKINNMFNNLLDIGYVGKTIESSKSNVFVNPEDDNKSILLIPLFTANSTLGMVFVCLNTHVNEVPHLFIRLVSLMGSVFAGRLENISQLKDIEASNIILEQTIAQRTSDFVNSKRELDAILDSMHNGIIIADSNTLEINRTNPIAEDLIGLSNNELTNRFVDEFLTFEDDINKKKKNYESGLKRVDGNLIPILRTTSFLKLSKKSYRIESFFDITEIKEAQDKLENLNQILEMKVEERTVDLQILINKLTEEINFRLDAERKVKKLLAHEQEINELKSKFIAMVSHEFRTPLTVIKSSAQILENFKDNLSDSEFLNYIRRISRTVDMMTSLISNTLFMSNKENNQIKYFKDKVDIHNMIDEIVSDANIVNENKRKIISNIEIEQKYLNTDPKLLRLVISNLLNNALKYSDSGSEVIVNVSDNTEAVEFEVVDNGIGISKEDKEKIFDIFYRGQNVGNIAGTGLGMVVILESLKIISGKIELESELNKGSKFKVIIPK